MAKKKVTKRTPKLEAMLGEFMEKVDERLSVLEKPEEAPAPAANAGNAVRYVPYVQGFLEVVVLEFIDSITGRVTGNPIEAGAKVTIPDFWGGGEATFSEETRGMGDRTWKVLKAPLNSMLQIVLSDQGRVSLELKLKQEERFRWIRVLSFNVSNSIQKYTAYYGSEKARQRQGGGNSS